MNGTLNEVRYAADWLKKRLTKGPRLSSTLKQEAFGEGIALRTLWRAKRVLGVESHKQATADGPWFWKLK